MALTFWIDTLAPIVHLEFCGEVMVDDFASALEVVFRDARYRPGYGFLVDRRKSKPPTMEYVERAIGITLAHEKELAGVRWAVVAPPGPTRTMLEAGIALAKGIPLAMPAAIFDDVESAESWLRITAT